jgi:hypothetical protein
VPAKIGLLVPALTKDPFSFFLCEIDRIFLATAARRLAIPVLNDRKLENGDRHETAVENGPSAEDIRFSFQGKQTERLWLGQGDGPHPSALLIPGLKNDLLCVSGSTLDLTQTTTQTIVQTTTQTTTQAK